MLPVLPLLALAVSIIHFIKKEWFNASVALWMFLYFLIWALAAGGVYPR